jgi:hypothetical protein
MAAKFDMCKDNMQTALTISRLKYELCVKTALLHFLAHAPLLILLLCDPCSCSVEDVSRLTNFQFLESHFSS